MEIALLIGTIVAAIGGAVAAVAALKTVRLMNKANLTGMESKQITQKSHEARLGNSFSLVKHG